MPLGVLRVDPELVIPMLIVGYRYGIRLEHRVIQDVGPHPA